MAKAYRMVEIIVAIMPLLVATNVCAQDFPNKPIRIVTSAAGGGSDFVARLVAQGISPLLGQPVIVDNRGGGGTVTGEMVARSTPDGYTLLLIGSNFWIVPLLQKTSYDPVQDFSPISLAATDPNVLVVHPSVSARSVKELIALAKAKPGTLNYAAGTTGSNPHLAAELLKSMAGINLVRIPYKGTSAALNDVLAGQVQLMFASAATVAPHLKSERLRALAITSAQPSALAPELPTMAATLPGYEVVGPAAIFAPAKTPTATVMRLNREVVRYLQTSEAKERLRSIGSEVTASSPEALAVAMKSEMARLGKVIKEAGITAD